MPTKLKNRMIGSVTAIGLAGNRSEHAEVKNDDDGDEQPEQHQELALGEEVGFAGFVDELGNVEHRAMHGQIFQSAVDDQAESQAENAEENAEEQQFVAVDAEKRNGGEIRKLEGGFAAGFFRGLACAANDCAAVSSDNVVATAPNFAIRHASDRALVSQVRIDTPPVIGTKM